MTSGAKFRPEDWLISIGLGIGLGFAFSFLLALILWGTAPQFLVGGPTDRAGALEDLLAGLVKVFVVGGLLLSVVAGFVVAMVIRRRSTQVKSSEGWWPTARS